MFPYCLKKWLYSNYLRRNGGGVYSDWVDYTDGEAYRLTTAVGIDTV